MIKKTITGKALEITESIRDDGFSGKELVGILFVAVREITVDNEESINNMKDYFCSFMDHTKPVKRNDLSNNLNK